MALCSDSISISPRGGQGVTGGLEVGSGGQGVTGGEEVGSGGQDVTPGFTNMWASAPHGFTAMQPSAPVAQQALFAGGTSDSTSCPFYIPPSEMPQQACNWLEDVLNNQKGQPASRYGPMASGWCSDTQDYNSDAICSGIDATYVPVDRDLVCMHNAHRADDASQTYVAVA